MVLRHCQHSIGYMGDGFHRSKDSTNSIKVLKEKFLWDTNRSRVVIGHVTKQFAHIQELNEYVML